jgi:hypothetical protein
VADVVNLRQARKAKARAGREAEAAANRAAHGQTKSERALAGARAEQDARRIDGHRLEERRVPPLPGIGGAGGQGGDVGD